MLWTCFWFTTAFLVPRPAARLAGLRAAPRCAKMAATLEASRFSLVATSETRPVKLTSQTSEFVRLSAGEAHGECSDGNGTQNAYLVLLSLDGTSGCRKFSKEAEESGLAALAKRRWSGTPHRKRVVAHGRGGRASVPIGDVFPTARDGPVTPVWIDLISQDDNHSSRSMAGAQERRRCYFAVHKPPPFPSPSCRFSIAAVAIQCSQSTTSEHHSPHPLSIASTLQTCPIVSKLRATQSKLSTKHVVLINPDERSPRNCVHL
jgi:hypothetical protein